VHSVLIEEIELTLANVDLGTLSEFSAMVLFGNAFCHRIIRGTKLSGIRQIQDAGGKALYPAMFMTHLRVPSRYLLDSFAVWDRVAVGVDVQTFGRMILDSTFILARPGELAPDSKIWDLESYPSMRAGSLFIVDERREDLDTAVPREGHLAEMRTLTQLPPFVARFSEIQSKGGRLKEYEGNLVLPEPIPYQLITDRDVTWGHAIMFAMFIRIMDIAERQFLTERLFPGFHESLLNYRAVLERETFYLGNCFAGDRLRINIKGKVLPCPSTIQTKSMDLGPVAMLEFVFELYQEARNALVVVSRVKKLLAVPRSMKTARREAERILYQYGSAE
jgi:probable biosynthetic protein (TIGR04098 family)